MAQNPFVPEWRAGDKIAQITERSGKLPIDFLNVEFPNFSFAFIDAIRVDTFVNLQMSVEFIVKMAQATVQPINGFGANMNLLKKNPIPSKINLDPGIPNHIQLNPTGSISPQEQAYARSIATIITGGIEMLVKNIEKDAYNFQEVAQFKQDLAKDLAHISLHESPIIAQIIAPLQKEMDRKYTHEDALVQKLLQDSQNKF
jgi:hypothetical protein